MQVGRRFYIWWCFCGVFAFMQKMKNALMRLMITETYVRDKNAMRNCSMSPVQERCIG